MQVNSPDEQIIKVIFFFFFVPLKQYVFVFCQGKEGGGMLIPQRSELEVSQPLLDWEKNPQVLKHLAHSWYQNCCSTIPPSLKGQTPSHPSFVNL